jgi:DNA-damage-inducible protein D
VKRKKGLPQGEDLLDRAGPTELSAHEFQMNLAAEALLKDRISGEDNCIRVNREVASDVRKLVIERAGVKPEDLPLEPDHIKDVKRRVQSFLNPLRKLRGR